MARYENSVTVLQARTMMEYIETNAPKLWNRETIETFAIETVSAMKDLFPDQFKTETPDDDRKFIAFSLSACAKHAIKVGDLSVLNYIALLAEVKQENEKAIKDFGAFGDLFEILVRCALMRKLSLVRWSMLSVKDVNKTDIISKKYGKLELGHNGKTFSFGTMFDYMAGDYTGVIYGMFDDYMKERIYMLCRQHEYENALNYVTSYCALWEDKYDFQRFMDDLTRGKGITAKGANIQVVYNTGKYNAFVEALEQGKMESLYDTLQRK